jgi:putative phosphoserine phosphatase/1-acylglycerol-3-phosphate O-acyltransferase
VTDRPVRLERDAARVRAEPSNLPEATETTVPLVGNRAVVEATQIPVVPQEPTDAARIGAVFDVDRTLLPGTTAERLFLRYLWEQRELGLREALLTAGFVLRHLRPTPSRIAQGIRRHRPYLNGKDLAQMQQLGADCFSRDIRPRLARRGIETVEGHRERGHTTVMLSGSLWFLLQPMAEFLGINHVIATRLAVKAPSKPGRGPKLTTRLEGLHPYGRAKALLVQRFAVEHDMDLAASYAYADHHTDAEMLALVGHPICVNPDARLRREAEARGWPIEAFI